MAEADGKQTVTLIGKSINQIKYSSKGSTNQYTSINQSINRSTDQLVDWMICSIDHHFDSQSRLIALHYNHCIEALHCSGSFHRHTKRNRIYYIFQTLNWKFDFPNLKQKAQNNLCCRSSHHGQAHSGHTAHQIHNSGGHGGGGGGHGGGSHRSMAY